MLETILDKNDGIFGNILRTLTEYEGSRTTKDRIMWENEFNYWHEQIRGSSISLAKRYKERFLELKGEYMNRKMEIK